MEEEKIPLVLDLNSQEVNVCGYYVNDIRQYLNNVEFESFNKFMHEKHIGIINGKHLVYKEDFDKWKASNIQLL